MAHCYYFDERDAKSITHTMNQNGKTRAPLRMNSADSRWRLIRPVPISRQSKLHRQNISTVFAMRPVVCNCLPMEPAPSFEAKSALLLRPRGKLLLNQSKEKTEKPGSCFVSAPLPHPTTFRWSSSFGAPQPIIRQTFSRCRGCNRRKILVGAARSRKEVLGNSPAGANRTAGIDE